MDDIKFMQEALKEAQKAFHEGEIPVGAVLVKGDKIIGRGHNRREQNLNISSHAEIEAINAAAKKVGSWQLNETSLYVTLEPCLMCAGAISQARIMNLIYGCDNKEYGAIVSNYFVYNDPKLQFHPLVTTGILKGECEKILKDFFQTQREVKNENKR